MRWKTLKLTVAAAELVVVALVHPVIAKAGEEVLLARAVWADYESYLRHLGPNGEGYYAITPDGLGGAAAGCAPTKCRGEPVTREAALHRCELVSPPDLTCIIFAEGDHIEVKYILRPY